MPSKAASNAAIIRSLLAVSAPLKAREISRRLRITRNILIDTNQVNSALYGPLSAEVMRLADYSWRLKPVSAREPAGNSRASQTDFEIQLRRSIEYLKSSHFQHCIDACKKASSLNPKAATPYCLSARAYVRLGSPKKAAEHFEKAIQLGPKLSNSDLLACAIANEQAGDCKRAADIYADLVQKGASTRKVWRGYLDTLRHSFQYQEILRVAAQAIKSFPEDHEILWYRAVALEKLERRKEAHSAYLRVLRINPAHEAARACAQSLSQQSR